MPKKKKVNLTDTIPKIKKVVETKDGSNKGYIWRVQTVLYSPQMEIYASLCEDLIQYAVVHSPAIRSVTRRIKDDVQVITVKYSDTHRCTYHIEAF